MVFSDSPLTGSLTYTYYYWEQSTLEFNLRLQEYIELVRLGRKTEAIQYVQKYLSSWSESHLRQLQQAMTLLAFPSDTLCEPYKVRRNPI
jgi:macrophage erythroblast attacher